MIQKNQDSQPRQSSEVLQVLSGLLMVLFVAVMSVTIIGTALPTMMSALSGSESQYTWIVTAMMLASTVATPVSGLKETLDGGNRAVYFGISAFGGGY